jgi:iron complex transport system substrate-binding protein
VDEPDTHAQRIGGKLAAMLPVVLVAVLFAVPLEAAPAGRAVDHPASARAASPPERVMSINLCTDQLLLDLLPPARITSVYYLSREPEESYLSAEARRVEVNDGTAEQVVRERPDLVLAGLYTAPATRQLLAAVHIPMLELPPANDFQDIRAVTLQVGRAVGAEARARRLIAQMDATLAQLAATAPRRPISIVGWDGSGSLPGRGTLFDAIVTAAGAVNLGASPGLRSRRFDTEQLLLARPDLLAVGDSTIATPSVGSSFLLQPLVRRMYAGREIVYPERLYSCGVPQTAQAAVQIRRKMLQVLRTAPASS